MKSSNEWIIIIIIITNKKNSKCNSQLESYQENEQCAVFPVKKSGPFLKWTRKNLWLEDKKFDDNSQGLTYKRLHSLCMYCVDASIQGFEDNIKKNKERQFRAINNSIDNLRSNRATRKNLEREMGRKTTVWII